MPSYKLIYFQSRGRAEMTRLLFAAAGLEYEDCRLKDRKKAFEELKATGKLPFDQLPVLEVDGKVLAQSTAICKYVGKITGFAPTDAFEEAKADMIVCGLEDLFPSAVKFYMEKDEETKETLAKEFYGNTLPRSLDKFEKILKSSGGKYFAANKLTYADVMFFSFVELFEQFNKINTDASLLDHHPTLKEHSNTVASQPGIKKWLSERPKI